MSSIVPTFGFKNLMKPENLSCSGEALGMGTGSFILREALRWIKPMEPSMWSIWVIIGFKNLIPAQTSSPNYSPGGAAALGLAMPAALRHKNRDNSDHPG